MISALPKGAILTGCIKKSYGKFLHSVVEIEKQGKPYIIDYTKNLIMPKEQYFKLTNFEEIERISDEEFFSDLVATLQLDLSQKEYLTFRSEIMNDLKKNMFLFTENEEIVQGVEHLKQKRKELKQQFEKNEEER